jgi:hypothetical protein
MKITGGNLIMWLGTGSAVLTAVMVIFFSVS